MSGKTLSSHELIDSLLNGFDRLRHLVENAQESNDIDFISFQIKPYIPGNEIPGLMPEVREFEPHLALDGGNDGLDFIRRLLEQAQLCLKNNGLLAFEHGHRQRKDILALLKKFPGFEIILTGDDLSSNERFFILRERK
jgi:hypothetical protein